MSSAARVPVAPPPPRARSERRILVFNPSHKADDVGAFGHYYHFDARGIGQCSCAQHAVRGPSGVLLNFGIHDITDWPRNEKGILMMDGAREITVGAQRIADFIVSEECRGGRGFVVLEGTEKEIAEQKDYAIRKFVSFYTSHAESIIARWEADVADYRHNRPGDLALVQPHHVREAYDFRDKNSAYSSSAATRLPWVCNYCGADYATEEDALRVCGPRHPGVDPSFVNTTAAPVIVPREQRFRSPAAPEPTKPMESPEQVAERLAALATEPPDATEGTVNADSDLSIGPTSEGQPAADEPARPGLAPTSMPAGILRMNAAKLLKQAEAAGMTLSVSDKKALAHGDADAIADVKARLKTFVPPAPVAPAAPVAQ